ncbi:MAG: ArnT family glycosyltransferase [Candidatus Polarisedimenticolia bacterium]
MPISRPRLISALISLWLLIVLVSYHFLVEPFPALHVLSLLGHVALLGLVTASAWGLGSLALRPLGLDAGPAPRILIVMVETATGLGTLALGVFALAAAGLLYRPAVLALVIAGVAALGMQRGRRLAAPSGESAPWSRVDLALLALLALAAVLTFTAAVAPPEFYDALVYHLAIPDHYIQHHGMVPIEGNFYAHYPANMGMLYAMGLLLRDAAFAQSLHWLCGVLSVFTLYAIGVRHAARTEALLACVLFGLIPGVMLVSTAAISDLTITLFGTVCFAAVLEWWESGDRRWLVPAGIAAGLAMGTKYTAALVVCLPCAAALAACRGRSWAARGAAVVLVGAVALALLSPWLVRNAIFTGNPVAPYLSSSTDTPDVLDEMHRYLPDAGMAGLARHVMTAPWNTSMRSLGYAGQLGPVFLILLPALPFLGRLPRVAAPAALMAGIGFVAWAAVMPVTRYVMPVLPLVALLAALAARRVPRPLAAVAVGWPVLYGLYLYCFLILTIGAWRPVTGAETAQDYLSRRVTYYPAAAFMDTLPSDVRVLFVGEGCGFYVPRPFRASTPLDPPLLDGYAARAPQGEAALLSLLRHEGFTHLLVSGPELRRNRRVSADDVMRRFFPSGSPRLVFERNDVRLYALPG